ncbi:MAG: glycosyltransferase [Nitrospirota bacterium]|nr:glycosyltransferase [Nitrospirota bacterium]
MEYAPIILFAYNRPEHLRRTIESLKHNEEARDSDLFIYSDGPKTPSATLKVAEVRAYLKTIEGFRQVTAIERQENMGLARSVIAGVSEIIGRFSRAIVLEDDLVTSPYFLRFMNEALVRYENDDLVMQISGHMFPVEIDTEDDALFLPFTTSWGWATWKRAWEHFDPAMTGYAVLKKDRDRRRKFNLDGAYAYFRMLEAQFKGKIDSWAIRWYLSVFMLDGLALFPVKTLVNNIGFDGSGMHCGYSDRGMNGPLDADFLLKKYPGVQVNEVCKKKVFACLAGKKSFRKRAVAKLAVWLR